MALPLGPGARTAAGLEIGKHSDLPLFEAFSVHVPAGGARVVVAYNTYGVLDADGFPGAQALAGYAAAAGVVGVPLAGGAVPSRGHGARRQRNRTCRDGNASHETHACRSARGRLITASERKRNFKSAARRRAAAPPCTGLTLRRGGAGGCGGAARGGAMRPSRRVGRKCLANFHFRGSGRAGGGRRAADESERRAAYDVRRIAYPCTVHPCELLCTCTVYSCQS